MLALATFLLTIVIVVGVHEYGHYSAARLFGVRVLRFAIGFGRPLLKYTDRNGTEWRLCPVPLGGYVQMVHDAKMAKEHDVPEEQSLEGIARWKRAIVIAAGPFANFVLAAVLFFGIALSGETGLKATIGKVIEGSVAQRQGFAAGESIVEINGRQAVLWTTVYEELFTSVGDRDTELTVESSSGVRRRLGLPTGSMPPSTLNSADLLETLGIKRDRSYVTLELDEVVPGSPAAQAGLQKGDYLLAGNGKVVDYWDEMVALIRASPGEEMELIFVRDGEERKTTVVPESVSEAGVRFGRLGVVPVIDRARHSEMLVTQREGPLDALATGVRRTWNAMTATMRFFVYLVRQQVSPEHLSGPIGIAKASEAAASYGVRVFLMFVAQISVSLGVINLVPIPVLDGGHLLRYAIEGVMRRPLPDRIVQIASVAGMVCVLALMLFAFYIDLT